MENEYKLKFGTKDENLRGIKLKGFEVFTSASGVYCTEWEPDLSKVKAAFEGLKQNHNAMWCEFISTNYENEEDAEAVIHSFERKAYDLGICTMITDDMIEDY